MSCMSVRLINLIAEAPLRLVSFVLKIGSCHLCSRSYTTCMHQELEQSDCASAHAHACQSMSHRVHAGLNRCSVDLCEPYLAGQFCAMPGLQLCSLSLVCLLDIFHPRLIPTSQGLNLRLARGVPTPAV